MEPWIDQQVVTSFLWLGELWFSFNYNYISAKVREIYLRGKTHVDNICIYIHKNAYIVFGKGALGYVQKCIFRPTRSEDSKKQFAMCIILAIRLGFYLCLFFFCSFKCFYFSSKYFVVAFAVS